MWRFEWAKVAKQGTATPHSLSAFRSCHFCSPGKFTDWGLSVQAYLHTVWDRVYGSWREKEC